MKAPAFVAHMTKKQKKQLKRIVAAVLLLIPVWLIAAFGVAERLSLPLPRLWEALLFLLPYGAVGWPVLKKAAGHIAAGQIFDENFLMALATVGAFILGEYPEAVAVMLFYQIGELFESCAVSKSRRSVAALTDLRPDTANVERNGILQTVSPEEVAVGECLVIRPGERIPLDGIVASGASGLDTAALTGEPLPREVTAGDAVAGGCINLTGVLRVTVTRAYGESTVARILSLMEDAGGKKAKSEAFITRFARYYTPAVVIGALALALLGPFFSTGVSYGDAFPAWLYRALTFLVISCPCALVISVPLTFFGGMGGASRQGILIKGSPTAEALARCDTVVFDKTGTLTQGRFHVTDVTAVGMTEEELLTLTASAEKDSPHPLAAPLRTAAGEAVGAMTVTDTKEIPGQGVSACVNGRRVCVGNERLMASLGCEPEKIGTGTVIHVAVDGVYAGRIALSDTVKEGAAPAVASLRRAGVRRIVMLTGDREETAREASDALGLDDYYASLLPGDKVARLETLQNGIGNGGTLLFVGDGINDAPALARADVGAAMGALGSDAAVEAADVVIMDDNPEKAADAIRIGRRILAIVRQNVVFALGVKIAVLILGALGLAGLWWAVAADVGVSVLAILNAMRTLYYRKKV